MDPYRSSDDMKDGTARRMNGKRSREAKMQKWQDKQTKLEKRRTEISNRDEWIEKHSDFVSVINLEDVRDAKNIASGNALRERLSPYFNLQDNSLVSRAKDGRRRFIAEGTETVRLLMQQLTVSNNSSSGLFPVEVESIFVKPSVFFDPPVSLIFDFQKMIDLTKHTTVCVSEAAKRAKVHVMIGAENVLSEAAGFTISRGALACGFVPENRNFAWLMEYFRKTRMSGEGELRLLALDGICDTANLGSVVRCASAFGVHAVLLSKDCCDPWYRRAVRVSMGHIFRIPCVRVDNLVQALTALSQEPFAVTSYAAVIDPRADLLLENIAQGAIPKSWCCIVGSEGKGISCDVIQAATTTLRIGMYDHVDSLSVPVATGILLHGLSERSKPLP
jgi:tRNA G18 (ribose-2'-O)-methylase SpoU